MTSPLFATHEPPTISVVIPVYNGGEAFARCLACVALLDPPPREVIVVDDGSSDQSVSLAKAHGAIVLHTGRQQGPSVARNLGARSAQGDVLLFVDADCEIQADAIRRVSDLFGANESVDALIGSYDDEPSAPNLLSQYKNLLHHYVHQSAGTKGFTFWGACGAIRRQIFEQSGGFDEGYARPCIEDIELGYRLVEQGRQIRICHDLKVRHLKKWTPRVLFHTDFFLRAIPWSELILRAGRMENDLNISYAARARVALSMLIAAGLVLGCWFWPAWVVSGALALLLLELDLPVLSWFRQKRGTLFAIRILPWHWFSHLYSGVAFLYVWTRYQLGLGVRSKEHGRSVVMDRGLGELIGEDAVA
jgi:glycosyltransferase involved in cell wall biosynthesis